MRSRRGRTSAGVGSLVAAAGVIGAAVATRGAVIAPHTIQPVLVVPSDGYQGLIPKNLAWVDGMMRVIRDWYSLAVGLDARLEVAPAKYIIAGRATAAFAGIDSDTWFNRVKDELQDRQFGVGTSANPHVIVGFVQGGEAYAATTYEVTGGGGYANVSMVASAGVVAHELGHAFGLDHPSVNNPVTGKKDNDYTVMYQWSNWPIYGINPADPTWPLHGLHAWDNDGNGKYQDQFMAGNRADWFRTPGVRQVKWDPSGLSNPGYGGPGTWDASLSHWSWAASGGVGAATTATETTVAWDNLGGWNAVFTGNSATVTVAQPVTVGSLVFYSDGYVLTGAAITVQDYFEMGAEGASGPIVIRNPLILPNGLRMIGYGGQLAIAADQTYTTGTTISAGQVFVGNGGTAGSLGTGPVLNYRTLNFKRTDAFTFANDLSGTGDVEQVGSGRTTMTGALTYTGDTTVSGGELVLASPVRGGKVVTVSNGTLLTVGTGGGNVLRATGVDLRASGTLDLNDNPLVIDYAGTSGTDILRSYLARGRGTSGAWTGTGLRSGTAAGDAMKRIGVGYVEAADVLELGLSDTATWAGVTVDATTLLVRYAYYGDTNLDGWVDADDYTRVDRGCAKGLSAWSDGDFDYDGAVTTADYLLIDRSFVLQSGAPDPTLLAEREARFGLDYVAALMASVPEPTAIGGMAIAAAVNVLRGPAVRCRHGRPRPARPRC